MWISRPRAVLLSLTAATALVAGASSPALAAPDDAPMVLSADLTSAQGDGCAQPAVQLGDGTLSVQAQTGADSSLLLDGGSATATECVLAVHIQLDQPARVRATQYVLTGSVSTTAGTSAGRYFESSLDGTDWYGQRTTSAAGSVGPFAQGGGSRFDPWSDCATDLDLSFRVGLSLTSATGVSAADSTGLDAPNGAVAELDTDSGAC
jgi:hypothetical protein